MQLFDAADTHQLLPFGPLVRALDAMLVKLRAGRTRAPVRTAIPLPNDGVLLLMPATDGEFASLKTVTVHMGNASKRLPSIHGAVLLINAGTGQHLAVFDGPTLTSKRMAAVSLLGAIKLKGQPKGKLLIVGAGVQAAAHARAFWSEGKLEEIYMSALNSVAAARFEAIQEMPKPDGRPVIFKSVGHSLWDLTAAELAYTNRR